MIKWLHTRKGFTLVEVIIVLVISGIVAVIAVPSVSNYISYTSAKECKALISDLTSDIRKIVTTNKYSSDTYKVDISTAVKNELAELSGGIFDNKSTKLSAIYEATSTVTFIAPLIEANSSVDGEIYTVTLDFSDTDVKVSVNCSMDEHKEANITGESMSIYFGKSVADIAIDKKDSSTIEQKLYDAISDLIKGINDNKYVEVNGSTFTIKEGCTANVVSYIEAQTSLDINNDNPGIRVQLTESGEPTIFTANVKVEGYEGYQVVTYQLEPPKTTEESKDTTKQQE